MEVIVRCDGEVPGASLTHRAAEFGLGQAAHAHLPLAKPYNNNNNNKNRIIALAIVSQTL